jgi:hypothetical protein
MIDMFASEYGWTSDYVKFELPMHDAVKLIHAILYRRGVKTYKRTFEKAENANLGEKLAIARKSFDTSAELEGIVF